MSSFTFTIPMHPKGKARPRVTRSGHAFMPADYRKWMMEVKGAIRSRWDVADQGYMINPKSSVHVHTFFRTKGYCRSDASNCHDALLDAMQGIVYKNDKQVLAGEYSMTQYAGEDLMTITVYW